MFLKILENNPLLRLLFKDRSQDIRNFLDDYLCKYFTKKDIWLYETSPESLPKLNEILFNLKEHFAASLGSAPIPFIFLISEERPQIPISSQVRSGKIFLHPKVVGQVRGVFEKLSLFHKIEKLDEDLFELTLPSTVDPKLVFFFKDYFFHPEKESCLFCRTYLHESQACPGLKVKNPLREFQNYLNFSFVDLAQNLWEALKSEDRKETLMGFLCRHFYLFPAFLKIPFYFLNEIENWTQLHRPLEFPVRGGDLYLALEELLLGNLNSAKSKFQAHEGEIRAELGLLFLNLLRRDFPLALYHLENALIEAKTPFLKSYLLFLKGYLYHYQRDQLSAEECYRGAIKLDATCIPAFYSLHLLHYEREENWQKIYPFFQNLYTIYLAFLEPGFIKHQRELEESLQKTLESFREDTVKRLREVEDKFHQLREIFNEEEKKEYERVIQRLRENTYRGGLLLIEEAGKRALELALELNSYIFSKLKKYRSELEKIKNSFNPLESFWKVYPYKEEDVIFGKKLTKAWENVNNLEKKLKKTEIAKELKGLERDITQLRSILTELTQLKEDLHRKWIFREKVYKFLVRFLLAEGLLVTLFLLDYFMPDLFSAVPIFTMTNFFLLSFILFLLILLSIQINRR